MTTDDRTSRTTGRREFFKWAAGAAAALGWGRALVDAQGRAGGAAAGTPQTPPPPPVPLGNGEHPAFAFQAYPGGTGAYLEKVARARGRAAFDRVPFVVQPWTGPVPGREEDVAFLPLHRLSALIRARRLTSVDLTNIYLERLKRYDPLLLCAVTIMEGQAREAAQQADAEIKAGKYRGPLHGIPWGVKDLFSTKGVRTTWGNRNFENRLIDEDAAIVVTMREAGAVLIAKLATGEFAAGDNWYRGQTKNPWNPAQGSSGSSAGPASATAAGCVAFGIGTETQGSIVSPTIRCGLSALRPTFGRVTRHGGMVLAWSMDKIGPICRTVEDCALVFSLIHGADESDPSTVTAPFQFERKPNLGALRIGYDEQVPKDVLDTLRRLGASLTPMKARPANRGGSSLGVETAAAFDFYVQAGLAGPPPAPTPPAGAAPPAAGPPPPAGAPPTGGAPPPGTPEEPGGRGGRGGGGRGGRFYNGRTVTALDFLQAQRRRLILMREMAVVMANFDMYVSANGDVQLTNQTGHPAVVFPTGFREGENGQPTCTTIIGQLFNDDKILSVAHAYQQATDWHTRRPKLPEKA